MLESLFYKSCGRFKETQTEGFFSVNLTKFFSKSYLQNTSWGLLLNRLDD